MADTTTTTTEVLSTTTTPTVADQDQLHRTDLAEDQVGAGAQAPVSPSNKELLDSAATASPHADRNERGTKTLGHEGKTPEESQEDAKREALHNSQGEQDLH